MTSVHFALFRDGPDGRRPVTGSIVARRTKRGVDGNIITLPLPMSTALVDGEATLPLAPTGPDWCWQITEPTTAGLVRYVAVPDSSGVLEYSALPDVDPATLDPAAEPEAAWWAALEAGAYGVAATPDPDDPHVLLVRYPVWRAWPGDPHSIAIPVLVGGISQ